MQEILSYDKYDMLMSEESPLLKLTISFIWLEN